MPRFKLQMPRSDGHQFGTHGTRWAPKKTGLTLAYRLRLALRARFCELDNLPASDPRSPPQSYALSFAISSFTIPSSRLPCLLDSAQPEERRKKRVVACE